jgi:tetratricopeptide (TPR) repeat protein
MPVLLPTPQAFGQSNTANSASSSAAAAPAGSVVSPPKASPAKGGAAKSTTAKPAGANASSAGATSPGASTAGAGVGKGASKANDKPGGESKEPPKPAPAPTATAVEKGGASDAARRLYSEAEQAFAAGDYRKAISLFQQADKQVPRAELEYNIALAYEAMGDKAAALEAYRSYLRRAPVSSDRSEVEANVTRLAKELGKLQLQQLTVVTSPAGATVLIDAQAKGFSPWTGEVQTGRHQLTVRRIGSREAMQNVTLGVDQPVEVSVVLEEDPAVQAAEHARLARQRAEEAQRDRPTMLQRIQPITWGLMGAGAAGLVGAGAFEQARANSEDDARLAATQLAAERELESAESQQTTARVLLGVGAGAMILGGVFLYIDLNREPDSATQLTAGCAGRRCGLYARGNW